MSIHTLRSIPAKWAGWQEPDVVSCCQGAVAMLVPQQEMLLQEPTFKANIR